MNNPRAITGLKLLLEMLSCRRGQLLAFACLLSSPLQAQKAPLAERDIADIATLLMLEDTRDFNSDVLRRILRSEHPELRRRAALSIARINDARGRALVRTAYPDRDTAVSATLVFAVGQMKDSAAVMWLDTLLKDPNTPVTVAFEGARSLGKIRTPNARSVLASYLVNVNEAVRTRGVIGEALLSIGRFKTRGEIAPVVRHTRSRDEGVWRAAWALRVSGNPAGVPELLRLSADRSAIVRSWAVSGLMALRVDSSGVTRAAAIQRLVAASHDTDRRVRTEAIRAMIRYDDDASFEVLRHAVDSRDTWLSVSAAEALGRRRNRTDDAIDALMRAAQPDRPSAVRIVAVNSLYGLRPESARAPGEALATDTLPLSQRVAAEIATLLASKPSANQPIPAPPDVSAPQRPIRTGKSAADYRALAERWVVPVYRGKPAPRIEWRTPRGVVELEVHSADAPLGSEVLMQLLADSAFVGSEFYRVDPNYVAQLSELGRGIELRDEVTRRGLTRGNLSWGSWGLDMGAPTYTLGIAPQAHNEGDFTTLGHVVRGMEVVDRIELGDRIISARRIR